MTSDSQKNIWPGWETVRLIGRGSFGAVYEIQRDVFGDVEKAALKVISIPQNASDIEELYSDGYDDESITSTFQSHLKSIVAEYTLMRKMNGSANIVNCDDIRYVQHDDSFGWDIFIKMELLTPLAKSLPSEITDDLVIKVAKDMCAALMLCKKHGIIHRDIKPQNIFVSPNGDYKLGDFGIAKTVEKTMGGTKIGTYKYMAPEVYNNQPYGAGADIYSLGLVLYWLLNERRLPFLPLPPATSKAGEEEEARNRRFSGAPIPAPVHGSDELKRIVLKACAYDPNERYTSAAEMLVALKALSSDSVAIIPPEPNPAPISDLVPVSTPEPISEPVPTPAPEPNPEPEPKPEKKQRKLVPAIMSMVAVVMLMLLLLHFCSNSQEANTTEPDNTEKQPQMGQTQPEQTSIPAEISNNIMVKEAEPTKEYLEKMLYDDYSAIGYYEVSSLAGSKGTTSVSLPVGEIYDGNAVIVCSPSINENITAVVVNGAVTVDLIPDEDYLVQIKTDDTSALFWSEWSTELPEEITLNSHQVEVNIMYRTSQKEYKESSSNSLSGWELYDSHANSQPYGEWSKWSETVLSATATLDVQLEHQYRYRTKETTSSTASTLSGWKQYASEDEYSYGEWSGWWSTPVTADSTTEVQTKSDGYIVYGDSYINGVWQSYGKIGFSMNPPEIGSVFGSDESTGWYSIVTSYDENILYRYRTITVVVTYYFYRWTNWSDWSSDSVASNSDREVQERDIYRSREIYGDTIYCFWRWGEWSDWSLDALTASDDTKIETQVVYRYIQ